MGKLHMERSIGKEIIKNSMGKIWKTTKPFLVCEVGSNIYIFSFNNEVDMNWVLARRPWLFESFLLSLKPFDGYTLASKMDFSKEAFWVQLHELPIACMNEDMGIFISNTIGLVKACDVQIDGSGWGTVLRVFIELDLYKPITKGRTLSVKGSKIWIPENMFQMWKDYAQGGYLQWGEKSTQQQLEQPICIVA